MKVIKWLHNIKEVDILKITPLEALNILDELKKEASNKKDV